MVVVGGGEVIDQFDFQEPNIFTPTCSEIDSVASTIGKTQTNSTSRIAGTPRVLGEEDNFYVTDVFPGSTFYNLVFLQTLK